MTKAISLDNLAQFKANCDQTYAKVGEGGGITQSTVIERPEALPTATADSPDFVQTPDGTLYRKKAVEGGSLLGTWVFNNTISSLAGGWSSVEFNVSFTSNNVEFIRMNHAGPDNALQYYNGTQYIFAYDFLSNTWDDTAYQTIQITDISALTNEEEFTSWLTANATKQGGGASVSYEYVAQQDAGTSGGGGGESTVTGYSVTVDSTYDVFIRDNKGILKKHVGNSGQKTYQNITEIYYYYSPGSDYFNISNPTYVATVLAAEKNTTKYYHDFLQGDISITISAGGGAAPVG